MFIETYGPLIRNLQLSHRLLNADFPDRYRASKDQILSIDDGRAGRFRESGVVFKSPY